MSSPRGKSEKNKASDRPRDRAFEYLKARHDILRIPRERAMPLLVAQTQELMDAGAEPGDIIWLLTPTHQGAHLAKDVLADAAPEPELAFTLRTFQECLPPGYLSSVYVGPEGVIMDPVAVDICPRPEPPSTRQ